MAPVSGFKTTLKRNKLCPQLFLPILVIVVAFAGASSAAPTFPVYIRDLKVPVTIVNGSEPNVVLDCDYRLEKNDTTLLVVNWYLNHSELVYQWIYGNPPQALGRLHDRVNLSYEASEVAFEMYRALQIINPTTELSGEYSCKVSSGAGEAYKTAKMIIYSPATDVDLKISSGPGLESNVLNISCWAYGVYPKPTVTLYYGDNDTHRQPLEDVEIDVSNTDEDAFDTYIYKLIDKKDVSSSTLFTCDLKITDTNYYMRKEVYWQKGLKNSLLNSENVSMENDDSDDDESTDAIDDSSQFGNNCTRQNDDLKLLNCEEPEGSSSAVQIHYAAFALMASTFASLGLQIFTRWT